MTEMQDHKAPEPEETSPVEQLELTSPEQAATPRDFLLWVGVLLLGVLTAYGPALRGDFIWNDARYLNPTLSEPEALSQIWNGHIQRAQGDADITLVTPQYEPLARTLYWLEWQIFGPDDGIEDSLVPYHVVSMVLHGGGAVLLWFILRRLRVPGAWIAAAVFALHPVNAEAVAWLSGQGLVLGGTLMLGTILTYLVFAGVSRDDEPATTNPPAPTRWDLYGLALVLFALGLLSSALIFLAPVVLAAVLWWKRQLDARQAGLLAPLLVMGLVWAGVSLWLQTDVAETDVAEWALSGTQRLMIAGVAPWFYAWKLVLPINLSFVYPRWDFSSISALGILGLGGWIVLLAGLWVMQRRIGRAPFVAVLSFILLALPATVLFKTLALRYGMVYDHFQYLGTPALIALITGAVALLVRRIVPARDEPATADVAEPTSGEMPQTGRGPSPLPYIVAIVVLLVLTVTTWLRAKDFDTNLAIWEDTLQKNPQAYQGHLHLAQEQINLGQEQRRVGMVDAAVQSFETAAAQAAAAAEGRPNDPRVFMYWGVALTQLGHNADALEKYDQAIALSPEEPLPHFDKGRILLSAGQTSDAVAALQDAVRLARAGDEEPERIATMEKVLADALVAAIQPTQAIEHYRAAIDANPQYLDAYKALALLYVRVNRAQEALDTYNQALGVNEYDKEVWQSLARLMASTNNMAEATYAIGRALEIDRQDPVTLELAERIYAAYQATTQPTTAPTTAPSETSPAEPETPGTEPAAP